MKTRTVIVLLGIMATLSACNVSRVKKENTAYDSVQAFQTNAKGQGPELIVEFTKGPSYNYPLMAIWIEDTLGNFVQTLYVSRSIATGIFQYGKQEGGKWIRSERRHPEALPYWAHKRGVKAPDGLFLPTPDNPVPDAYTGPTPTGNFKLISRLNKNHQETFKVMFEINQNWDWNAYWTNNKYPDDEYYKTSCQPALVYQTIIDPECPIKEYVLKPIGHSHYSGKNGNLYKDLGTITTALDITKEIKVIITDSRYKIHE